MTQLYKTSGIWLSRHHKVGKYKPVASFYVKMKLKKEELAIESLPNQDNSYMSASFTIEKDVATGTYQSYNAPNTAAPGSRYYGVAQLVVQPDGKSLKGKGVGFSKSGKVEPTIWELVYIGSTVEDVSKS